MRTACCGACARGMPCARGGVADSIAAFGDTVVRGVKSAVDATDKPWQIACRRIPRPLRAKAAAFLFSSPYTLILDVTPLLGTVMLPLRILLACGVSGSIQLFAKDALKDLNDIRDRRGLKGLLFSLPVTSDAADFVARYDAPLRAVLEPVARGQAPSFRALFRAAQIALQFLDDEDRLAATSEIAELAGLDAQTVQNLSSVEVARRLENVAKDLTEPTRLKDKPRAQKPGAGVQKIGRKQSRSSRSRDKESRRRARQRRSGALTPEEIARLAAEDAARAPTAAKSSTGLVLGGLALAGLAYAATRGR